MVLKTLIASTFAFSLAATPFLCAQGSLQMQPANPLVVTDPTCAGCDHGADGVVQLRNDSSGSVKLSLGSGALVNKVTGKAAYAPVSLSVVQDPQGNHVITKDQAASGETVLVRVDIKGLLEEGDWEADIYNQGTSLGKIKVIKYHLPLGIKLDVPTSDNPQISFERNQPLVITLKNDDAVSYPLCWTVIIAGQPNSAKPDTCSDLTLPAKGVAHVVVDPSVNWFHYHIIDSYLKDENIPGQLVLSFRPSATDHQPIGSRPATVLKFTAALAYYSKTRKDWCGGLLILITLIFGAFFPVVLNAWIPNLTARLKIKKQLKVLEQEIRDLPIKLSSRLRVSAGVEWERLRHLMSSRTAIGLQFSSATSEVKDGTERLQRRVRWIQDLGQKRNLFEALRSKVLFPSLIYDLEAKFKEAVEALRKVQCNDSDIQAATTLLKEIDTKLRNLEEKDASNDRRPEILARRAHELNNALDLNNPKKKARLGQGKAELEKSLPDLFARFDEARRLLSNKDWIKSVDHPADKYADWDLILTKMEILRDYLIYRIPAPDLEDPSAINGDLDRDQQLKKALRCQTWEQLEAARLLVDEMKAGHFSEELEQEVTTGNLESEVVFPEMETSKFAGIKQFFTWIKRILKRVFTWLLAVDLDQASVEKPCDQSSVPEPQTIYPVDNNKLRVKIECSEVREFQAIPFSLCFTKQSFNESPVREECVPIWDFHHDNLMPEEGWEVTHYFPSRRGWEVTHDFPRRKEEYTVSVKLHHKKSGKVFCASKRIHVHKEKRAESGVMLSLVQTGAVLFLAALGLFTGAKDQPLKLDTIPALIAIFTLGFTSDRIKSLLSQSPQ